MPQNAENAYLVIKNPIASRALRQVLDPSQFRLTLLCDFTVQIQQKGPKFLVWPPLYKKLAMALNQERTWELTQLWCENSLAIIVTRSPGILIGTAKLVNGNNVHHPCLFNGGSRISP